MAAKQIFRRYFQGLMAFLLAFSQLGFITVGVQATSISEDAPAQPKFQTQFLLSYPKLDEWLHKSADSDWESTETSAIEPSVPMAPTAVVASGIFVDSGQTIGGDQSNSVALGDLDGDGDLDALFPEGSTNQVWWNNGNGVFSDSGQTLGILGAVSVELGDLDGDNDLDAYLGINGGNPDTVWINQGGDQGGTEGVFLDSGQSINASTTEDIALGDLDGDNDLDVVIGNYFGVGNAVWINQGGSQGGTEGVFLDSGQSLGSADTWDVFLGDLDGDTDLDVFFANNNANEVWFNNGSGTFADSGQALGNVDSWAADLGDLDGDGDLDAFVANNSGQPDTVWLNNGSGIFTDSGQTIGTYSGTAVSLGDLDGDGDLDAFVGNNSGEYDLVYLNDGAANFTDSGQQHNNSNSWHIGLGDLDGDSDLDAFVARCCTSHNQVLFNASYIDSVTPTSGSHDAAVSANLTATTSDPIQPTSATDQTLVVHSGSQGTLNGLVSTSAGDTIITYDPTTDFHPGEIVQASVTSGILDGSSIPVLPYVWQFRTAVQGGSGNFINSGQSLGSYYSFNAALGDIDEDGDLDAFVLNGQSQANKIYLNDGNSTFTDSGQNLGNSSSIEASLGDIDGDGDLDAFVVNRFGDANRVYLNTNGIFTDSGQNLGNSWSYGVDLGDLDGDGDLDAFVTNGIGAVNRIYLNNNGTFTDSGQGLGNSDSYGVDLGDLDSDGDLDAFVTNIAQPDKIYLNDGSGAFTDSGQNFSSSSGVGIRLEDLDADGDLDAFVINAGQPNLIYMNDGSGTFTDSGQSLGSANSNGINLGDLDSDGDLDAYVVNANEPDRIYFNNNSGVFTDSGQSLDSGAGLGLSLGDLDSDGDLDAFIANSNQANTIWLNQNAAAVITAVTPDANSHIAAQNTNITITASESLTPTSVTTQTFIIHGSSHGEMGGTLALSAGDTVATHNPTDNFFPGELVHVSASSNIQDSDGAPIAPYVWQFRTAVSSGTGYFADSGQTLGNSMSYDVSLGDVDGDGDLDAFVADANDNWLFLNDGNGTFSDSGQTLLSDYSVGISLGDLDGDGDLDAFVANSNNPNQVFLNDGSGGFSDSGQTLGSFYSGDIGLGDIDGDGDLDAFVTNIQNQPNRVYLNDGNGVFSDSGQTLGSSWSTAVGLSDLDGDGDLDAFVANSNQANRVYLNDGRGTFTDSGQTMGTSTSTDVSLGDVDSDGDLDALVANYYSQANLLYLNDGNGTFTNSGQTLGSASCQAVSLADVDADGDLDAFVANYGEASQVFWNNGSGNFTDSGQTLGNSQGYGVSLGDLDGDGDLDAFIANWSSQPNHVWLNAVIATTATPNPNTHEAPVDTNLSITASAALQSPVDDQDFIIHGGGHGQITGTVTLSAGDTVATYDPAQNFFPGELVQASASSNIVDSGGSPIIPYVWQFRTAVSSGSGIFADSNQILGTANIWGGSLGDLDGDGDLDVFVTNRANQPNQVYLNNGGIQGGVPGTFTDSGQSLGNADTLDASLGDLDGDGDLDVFAANYTGQSNVVWLNDGQAQFTTNGQNIAAASSTDIGLGDLDGDGDLDAFVANTISEANQVYLNNGHGLFSVSTQSLGNSDTEGVALGDLDSDGDLDAFTANYSGQANVVWLNNGSGTFNSVQALGNTGSNDVALGDLDGDDDLDAFVTNYNDTNAIYLNDGSGAFNLSGQSFSSAAHTAINLGDVDSDGDLDGYIVVAQNQPDQLWLNDGGGNFTLSTQTLGSATGEDVTLGDLDGDGDLDAFITNQSASGIWLNQNPAEVIDVSPDPDTHTAPITTSLILTSSAPITNFGNASFFVHSSSGRVYGTPVLYGNIVGVLYPWDDLFPGDTIQAIASDSISGTNGVPLMPYIWQFRTAAGTGPGTFVENGQDLGSYNSFGISLGDLDGDGDLDAFSANTYGEANRVWVNSGDGNFSDSGQTLGSSDSSEVALGDLNGDGYPDAFVANNLGNNFVYFNDGSGTFADSGQSLDSTYSFGAALGDLDGDGDLDAFVTNSQSPGLTPEANKVYFNNGSGTFTNGGQNLGLAYSYDVALGDLDHDGDLDAFVTNSYDTFNTYDEANRVYWNDGSGNFTDSGQALGNGDSRRVDLGDLDDDGDLDAFVNNYGEPNRVYLNDGTGTFTDSGQTLGSSNSIAVALGDIEGDGDLDAFVANDNQPNLVWLNDGGGNFSDSGQTLGSNYSSGLSLGDLDGDGDLDAFVNNMQYTVGQPNKVWLNTVVVTDAAPDPNSHSTALDASLVITASDSLDPASLSDQTFIVHGSGHGQMGGTLTINTEETVVTHDLTENFFPGEFIQASASSAILDSYGGSLSPYVWDFRTEVSAGSGLFNDSGQNLGNSSSTGIAIGDLDGDGDLDAFVVNYGQEDTVWRNDDNGNFTQIIQTLDSGSSMDVALGDVDGDGDLDAFVITEGDNTLWQNDGSGAFTQIQSMGTQASRAVALGDVDGDGDLDAVVGNNSNSRLWVNDGTGVFSMSSQSLGGFNAWDIALGDFDKDGDLDVFFVTGAGEDNRLWANDGKGTFTDSGQSLGTADGKSVALGDIDNDGDLDAFIANWLSANTVWENDGSGTLTQSQSLGTANSVGVSLGDLEGDGDLDAFVANTDGGFGIVWLNNGGAQGGTLGTFSDSGQTLANPDSENLDIGDLDGDGDLDALIVNGTNNANQVWLNQDQADLSIEKSVDPAVAIPGSPITFTLTYTNNGPQLAANVVITDAIPASVINTSVSSTGAAITPIGGAPDYVWNVADLASGQGGTITIVGEVLTPQTVGSFVNTAVIDSATYDPNPANNTSSGVVTVPNVAPVAADDFYTTTQNTTLNVPAPGVLTNDTDGNGDSLTTSIQAAPSTGTLALNSDGSFSYNPAADYIGTVTFTYAASDIALSDTATTSIVVQPDIPEPDLAIRNMRILPTEMCRGQQFAVIFEYINQGNLDAGPHAATFFNESSANSFENQFGEAPIPAALAGQEQFMGFNTNSYITGTRYIRLFADGYEEITEFDEDNNIQTIPIYVKHDLAPNGSISINGGADFTNSNTLNLTLNATEPDSGNCTTSVAEMRFAYNGFLTPWEPYNTSAALTVPTDGESLTVYVQYRDEHTNTSDFIGDSILLDTLAPVTSVNAPGGVTTANQFTVSWHGTDNLSGLATYDIQYNQDGGDWIDWLTETTETSTEFPDVVVGSQYCFRSRGIDGVKNVEAYPDGNGDTCISIMAANPGVDLYVENLAFTQGIQTPGNSVPLVEGKPLMVRASLAASLDSPSLAGVTGLLHVSRNGQALPGSPLSPLETITVAPHPAPDSGANLLEFLLPSAWLTGTLEAHVEIDTENQISEVDEGNNRYPATGSETLIFNPLADLELTIIPIIWARDGQTLVLDSTQLLSYLSEVQQMFPAANVRVVMHNAYRYQGTSIDWEALLSEIDTLRETELPNPATNQKYLGLVPFPADYVGGPIGLAHQPGSTAVLFARPEQALDVPRYLAYTLGVHDIEGCGTPDNPNLDYPYPNGIIQFPGWDYAGKRFVPGNTHDLMANCPDGWISDFTYRAIYEQWVQTEPLLATYQSVKENISAPFGYLPHYVSPLSITAPDAVLRGNILVTGRIAPDGSSGGLENTFKLSNEISLAQSHLGDFRVALINEDGHEVDVRTWSAQMTNASSSGEQGFSLIFPGPLDDLGAVRLYYQDILLDELTPGTPPTVTITSAVPAALSGESYTLEWSASPPGPAVVRYSSDNGFTWKTLAASINATSYVVDLSTLAGTQNGIFEVIVSTGLESASAQLTGFSVENKLPHVEIFTPQPGADSQEAIVLSGSAFDLEEGYLLPGQLTWISDQDGVLGTGYTLSVVLSPGPHMITLQVIDSSGEVGRETKSVNGWFVFLPMMRK